LIVQAKKEPSTPSTKKGEEPEPFSCCRHGEKGKEGRRTRATGSKDSEKGASPMPCPKGGGAVSLLQRRRRTSVDIPQGKGKDGEA